MSDKNKYRAEFIWNKKGLKDWLGGRFMSFEIGYEKSSPKCFEKITQEFKLLPEEILFIDDSQSKINSVRSVGIATILYVNFEKFSQDIKDVPLK